jgi:hypothetical protein
MEIGDGPVGRHLPATARRIAGGSYRLQQLLLDSVAKSKADGAIAVVREEPVVAGPHRHTGSDEECLVTCAGYLEEDLLLAFEDDLPIVGSPREIHQPVELNQLLASKRGSAYRSGGLLLFC